MSQLLNESINIKNGEIDIKGRKVRIAYVDPKTSENLSPYKETLKKYGASFDSRNKRWYWILGNNNDEAAKIYKEKVEPCLRVMTVNSYKSERGLQTIGNKEITNKLHGDVMSTIDQLIEEMKNAPTDTDDVKGEVIQRLMSFKQDLINTISDQEFKAKLEPIMKFRLANKKKYSLANSILIVLQDPKATLVKPKSDWPKYNRYVDEKTLVDGVKPIAIWLNFPIPNEPKDKAEETLIKRRYLDKYNVRRVKELPPHVQEELKQELNAVDEVQKWGMGPYWYDVRFTKVRRGKKDLAGSKVNLPWFEMGEENEEVAQLINCVKNLIVQHGIKLDYEDESKLNGALGYSANGRIVLLKDAKMNGQFFGTAVHEFSHELLHQVFIKNNIPEAEIFYVGKDGGRPLIEQQAELCAWIVLKNFHYNMPTQINYVSLWGLNEDNAATVFDSVVGTAEYIVKKLIKMRGIKESRTMRQINEEFMPTGYELAKMVGCGDLYKRSKAKENNMEDMSIPENKMIKVTEAELKAIIDESVKILLEGQGWRYFMNHLEKLDDATPEEREKMEKWFRDPYFKHGGPRSNYIGRGDFNGAANFYRNNEHNYYDKQGMPTKSHRGKPIDKSFMGRMGRYAGIKAAEYATRLVNGITRQADALADPNKNPFSPFSKEGPVPFDED